MEGENSSDTGTGTMTTMVNNVSSSESNKGLEEEEGSLSQDEEAFKCKQQNGSNNGDITSSTVGAGGAEGATSGTKRFSADPLQNVMAKCPKLMLDR